MKTVRMCKTCHLPLIRVVRLERGSAMRFDRCLRCFRETNYEKIEKSSVFMVLGGDL